jgi:hypothetical protein
MTSTTIEKFDVFNRWTGEVQFTADIEVTPDRLPSEKLGLAVRWALENKANLKGADLTKANLNRADLSEADFSRANLKGANLKGANFSRADFSRANLSGADLSGADLSGAYLSGAYLSEAILSEADLNGANLSGAILSSETLRPFKSDLFLTLSTLKAGSVEALHLITKLRAGEVDGSTYDEKNECACLVGTIAAARQKTGEDLDRNLERPAERWFMMIRPGDKPEDDTGGGFAAKMALAWVLDWCVCHGIETESAQ